MAANARQLAELLAARQPDMLALLQEYEQPPLDPAIDDALVEYVEKRKKNLLARAS